MFGNKIPISLAIVVSVKVALPARDRGYSKKRSRTARIVVLPFLPVTAEFLLQWSVLSDLGFDA